MKSHGQLRPGLKPIDINQKYQRRHEGKGGGHTEHEQTYQNGQVNKYAQIGYAK
jgi:hypothetical protein